MVNARVSTYTSIDRGMRQVMGEKARLKAEMRPIIHAFGHPPPRLGQRPGWSMR